MRERLRSRAGNSRRCFSLAVASDKLGEWRARQRPRFQALLCWACLSVLANTAPAVADERPLVVITAAAIEQILLSDPAVREGKYLDLVSYSRCNYAYLEDPHVRFDAARVQLQLHFSARTGTELAGQCLGPGFSSDVITTATLSVAADALVLSDIEIRIPDAGPFESLIRQRLQQLVPTSQRLALLPLLKAIAAKRTALPAIAPDALVLTSLKTTPTELAVYGQLTLRIGAP